MTERQDTAREDQVPAFEELTGAAARLLREAIERADPAELKDVKQITGALKDLKELMEQSGAWGGMVIRIEGDPLDE